MAGKRKFSDLRYMFMRGLLKREQWQRSRHYLKSAAECTSRAIVSLELVETPIKSIAQAKRLEGVGGETVQRLKEMKEKGDESQCPEEGKFVSSAGALLVALLHLTEQEESKGTDDLALISEDALKSGAKSLSEEPFLENESGFCQAWWRIEILIKRGFVKRRQLSKKNVYQLLVLGWDVAKRLRGSQVMKEKPKEANPADNYLYTNDTGQDGIVLEVDTQEMGGDRVGLGEHCTRLERSGVQYRTQRLASGDYQWVWRSEGQERTVPVLVERKRADDLAHTLKADRFWRQITKMLDWKAAYREKNLVARLIYILEGDPADYVMRCADRCRGVGMCGNPTLEQVKAAIKDLESHPEMEVRRTSSVESTVQYLAVLTQDILKRSQKGDYDMLVVSEMIGETGQLHNLNTATERKPTETDKTDNATETDKTDNFQFPDREMMTGNDNINVLNTSMNLKTDYQNLETKWETDMLKNEKFNQNLQEFEHGANKLRAELPPLDQSDSTSVPDANANVSDAIVLKSEVKTENEDFKDGVFDMETELSLFSSFSGFSNLKRGSPDRDQPKLKTLSSPIKKIKLRDDVVQSSPSRHGKVYMMKVTNKNKVKDKPNSCSTTLPNESQENQELFQKLDVVQDYGHTNPDKTKLDKCSDDHDDVVSGRCFPEPSTSTAINESNSDSGDSLPEINFMDKNLLNNNPKFIESGSLPTTVKSRSSKQFTNEPAVIDDDSDTEYVPKAKRKGKKRNSKKRGKCKAVDESLVSQVADILPHYSWTQIRTTLVKCKLNIERTVAELLDGEPIDDEEIVDLT